MPQLMMKFVHGWINKFLDGASGCKNSQFWLTKISSNYDPHYLEYLDTKGEMGSENISVEVLKAK